MTNTSKDAIALLIAGSGAVPEYLAVGSGSGIFTVTQTALIAERSGTLRIPYTSRYIGSSQFVVYEHNISSSQMSGVLLTEFGLFISGTSLTGSMWTRDTFNSIVFNGQNELQVELKLEIF